MIPAIDIKHDLARLSWELGLMANERRKAAARAINKTMITVRKEASTALAEDYKGLRISALKKRIKLWPRADQWNLRSVLTFSPKRFRLTNWAVRQTKRGIVGRLPRGILAMELTSGRTDTGVEGIKARLRHAWIRARKDQPGSPNVWMREPGAKRWPIMLLLAPALSETLVARRLNHAMGRRARDRFQVVFMQEARGVRFAKAKR